MISHNHERVDLLNFGFIFQVTTLTDYTMNECLFSLLEHLMMNFVVTLLLSFGSLKVTDSDNWNSEAQTVVQVAIVSDPCCRMQLMAALCSSVAYMAKCWNKSYSGE